MQYKSSHELFRSLFTFVTMQSLSDTLDDPTTPLGVEDCLCTW